jgi:hypothetical protein
VSGRSLRAVCARSGRGLGVVWGAIWAQSRLGLQIGRLLGRLFGRELGRELCRELGQELGRELGWELGALGHAAPTWGIGAHCPDPNPSFFWRGAMPEATGSTINQWHARFQPDPTKRNTACASAEILGNSWRGPITGASDVTPIPRRAASTDWNCRRYIPTSFLANIPTESIATNGNWTRSVHQFTRFRIPI